MDTGMNDWLHNLPVAVDGPSSLWRYVPELDTIPAVKLRELVRRATSGTSTRGKLKLLGIAERTNIRGGVRRTCDTNDTEVDGGRHRGDTEKTYGGETTAGSLSHTVRRS
jgi:hypothetical protein